MIIKREKVLIFTQVLPISTTRNAWKIVRRICMLIVKITLSSTVERIEAQFRLTLGGKQNMGRPCGVLQKGDYMVP